MQSVRRDGMVVHTPIYNHTSCGEYTESSMDEAKQKGEALSERR